MFVIPPDCETDEENYVVSIHCPDGTKCKILIPIDPHSWSGECSRTSDEYPEPHGLNLVCPGHYT
jgi:hypothetical protein